MVEVRGLFLEPVTSVFGELWICRRFGKLGRAEVGRFGDQDTGSREVGAGIPWTGESEVERLEVWRPWGRS